MLVKCPECGDSDLCDDKMLGKRVKCVKCSTEFVIEEAPPPAPSDPFFDRLAEIMGVDVRGDGKLTLAFENHAEAVRRIDQIAGMKRQLELLKKSVDLEMKQVRSSYVHERAMIGKDFGSGLAGVVFGRRFVGSSNQMQREQMRLAQDEALKPFLEKKQLIEEFLLKLDAAKLQIKSSPAYGID